MPLASLRPHNAGGLETSPMCLALDFYFIFQLGLDLGTETDELLQI